MRQVSRAEAERLGGVTARPRREESEWTNSRTGEAIMVDRGLDPAWASNPGRDRERILAGRLTGDLDAADEALARAAARQVAGSPLLERQLAPMAKTDPPKGDLPVAFLEREWRDALGIRTQLVRLTAAAARKQRRKHPEIAPGDYRSLLAETLDGAQLVARETGHFGRDSRDLVFFLSARGETYKAVIAADGPRAARLATFYRSNAADLKAVLARDGVETVRDSRPR